MGWFSRAPKPPPQTDKRAMAEYIRAEARCPYCAQEFKTIEQIEVVYNFPDGRTAQMQKARARCDRDGLDIFAISPPEGGMHFVRPTEYQFFQSDGTRTNPDAFAQYMQSIPRRSPLEVLYETLIAHDSPFGRSS